MLMQEQSPRTVFEHTYRDADFTDPGVTYLDIDMENLDRYIGCTLIELKRATTTAHRDKLNRNLWQAQIVQKIGQHMEDETGSASLPHVPRPSSFGRTYYAGLSVQSVSKQVRSALLGHHWQYDMNAAVFAIKLMLYGAACGGHNELVGDPRGSFTREYVREKRRIRERLARDCFAGLDVPPVTALKAVKNALTAIGFGARTTGSVWMAGGGFKATALAQIILSPVARGRFLADPWVSAFLAEQKVIEDSILDNLRASEQFPAIEAIVRANDGVNGRVSRGGLMAYVYQQWETDVMDMAVDVLAHHGIEVVARIHDAFITRQPLSARVLDDIAAQWGLRDYLSMDAEEVRAWIAPEFKQALLEADGVKASHEHHIATEERLARIVALKRAGTV